jgi:hypothetical protein
MIACLALGTELGIVLQSWPHVDKFDRVSGAADFAMIHEVPSVGIFPSDEVIECDRMSCSRGIS